MCVPPAQPLPRQVARASPSAFLKTFFYCHPCLGYCQPLIPSGSSSTLEQVSLPMWLSSCCPALRSAHTEISPAGLALWSRFPPLTSQLLQPGFFLTLLSQRLQSPGDLQDPKPPQHTASPPLSGFPTIPSTPGSFLSLTSSSFLAWHLILLSPLCQVILHYLAIEHHCGQDSHSTPLLSCLTPHSPA